MMSDMCPNHPNWELRRCPWCGDTKDSVHINTESWICGYWEHIDKQPIYIRDKAHLKQECEKRGVLPRAFLKHTSQGKHYEFAKR
jgi:hypothetical protein